MQYIHNLFPNTFSFVFILFVWWSSHTQNIWIRKQFSSLQKNLNKKLKNLLFFYFINKGLLLEKVC